MLNTIAQIIGYIALACAVLSFQFGKGKRFFLFQTLLCLLFSLHFYLLSQYSGCLLNLAGAVNYIIFYFKSVDYKFAQKREWLYLICVMYVAFGVFSYYKTNKVLEILPAAAMILNAVTRYSGDLFIIRLSQVAVSSPVWFVYDFLSGSQAGAVNEVFAFTSAAVGLYRFRHELKTVAIRCCAKVNLSLAVGDKKADGYHALSTVMQSVTLCDSVYIRKSERVNVISFRSPLGRYNICHKAAQYFKDYGGAFIVLIKRIPTASGMGGGSADAAAVLAGLNKLYGEPYTEDELIKFARELGSDVPFMLEGGTALVTGTGEKIEKTDFFSRDLVIIKEGEKDSTGRMYARLDAKGVKGDCARAESFLKDKKLFNDFESVYDCEGIKQALINAGAYDACLSGSGPSVYGVFADETAAKSAYSALRKSYGRVFICKTSQKSLFFD